MEPSKSSVRTTDPARASSDPPNVIECSKPIPSDKLKAELLDMLKAQGHGELVDKIGEIYDDPQDFHSDADAYFAEQGLEKIREGAAEALVQIDKKKVTVIALLNQEPGNGDFQKLMDTLEGFKKAVIIEEIWNPGLRQHLIEKRGYKPTASNGHKRVFRRPE